MCVSEWHFLFFNKCNVVGTQKNCVKRIFIFLIYRTVLLSTQNILASTWDFGTNSKTFLKPPLKTDQILAFQDRLWLNAGQMYCRMLQESILQYFQPSFVVKTFIYVYFWVAVLDRFYCISYFSREVSDEPAHHSSLTRTIIACRHNVGTWKNVLAKS